MECLLCRAQDLELVEIIEVEDLMKIYSSITKNYNLREEFGTVQRINLHRCKACDFMFYAPQVAGSDKFYEFLQQYDWYYQSEKPEFKFAYKKIGKNDNVLEIGAGSGYFAKKLNCQSYTGLEFNEASIQEAKLKGINLIKEPIEIHSQGTENKYDVVCAFQVLEHISNPRTFIESCIRALKPGGKLIFAIPSADSYAANFPNHSLNLPPHHISLWTDKNLENIAGIFGLSLNEIFHETCDKMQYKLYLYALFLKKYNSIFGVKSRLVHTGLFQKIKNKVIMKLAGFCVPENLDVFTSRGQSVTVVYEKV